MPTALTEVQKKTLAEFEPKLEKASETGDLTLAEQAIKKIQSKFLDNRSHFRVLQAKLKYYEIVLDAGKTTSAKTGFQGVLTRANEGTRIHLEATAFMGICLLRTGKIEKAKESIKYVILKLNNIKSDARRQQFQERFIQRIEEELILSQLIGKGNAKLDPKVIQKQSIVLVKKSESELLETIAGALPSGTPALLSNVTSYSINLMPQTDQKLLPAPKDDIPKTEMGKKALAALKRIGWRTFCDETSNVYKLWSKGVPKVFNQGYFSSAIVTTLAEWRIGIPQLAAGLVATAMKFGCEDFCSRFKSKGIMIPKSEKG